MKLSRATPLFILAGFTAACADDPMRPDAQFAPGMSSVTVEAPGHVVEFRKNKPLDFEAQVAAAGGTVEFVSEPLGFARVVGLSAEAAAALEATQGVAAIYDDVTIQLAAEPAYGEVEAFAGEMQSQARPATAFRYSYQWNMRRIGADIAWAAGFLGSPDVTIAILDTGIDYNNYDTNGIVDLARSTSFVTSDNAILATYRPGRHIVDDLNGHGSNVASQASSRGVIFGGVNSYTTLIAVKVLGANGSGSLSGIIAGLGYAAEQGADVANMSLGIKNGVSKIGNGRFIGLTNKAFNYAFQQGMVVVVSAGNDTINMDGQGGIFSAYCEAPNVICVAATGPTASTNSFLGPWTNEDAGAIYSNTGRQAVTVSAPGGTSRGWVASVCPRSRMSVSAAGVVSFPCNAPPGYFVSTGYAGTSQAAPHVAGLVAKLVEVHGKNNPAQVKHALVKSVDDLGAPGADPIYGAGRINVAKALGL